MGPNPISDRTKLIQSKEKMFSQIYSDYRQSIYNYIFFRIGDIDLAEDITSEVFVKMVDKYDELFKKDRQIGPWLYTIARNLIIDHKRRGKILSWQPLSDQFESDDRNNPVKQTDTRLTQECLMVALDYLTDEQQQVILLKFIERRTNREVGRILEKPEGAIKSLQHRALNALQRALEKEPCYGN